MENRMQWPALSGRALLWLLVWLTLWSTASSIEAQKRDRQVWMQLSTGVARVGENVRLNVVANGGDGVRLESVPSVAGLRFGEVSGPRRSQTLTIINGRRRKVVESGWSIQIACETEGEFIIPGLTLSVAGEPQTTEPVTLRVVRDMSGENLGFFELLASSPKVVEGMPFSLELQFGWDQAVKANYANLSIPWWDKLYGAIEMESEEQVQGGESVTVNGAYTVPIERLQRNDHPGRVVFRIRRSFIATRSGKLELPSSFLEFGEKSRSLFQSGVKNNYFVRANELDLEVVPLPSEGRPFEFSGAVGKFRVRASVDARDLIVGDSIKLSVEWTGQGNMEFFDAPALDRLDAFNGFQFYGSTEEKSLGRRRVVYDMAPLTSQVNEIPAVPLWSFDPEENAYVKIESAAIPLRVRGLDKAIDLKAGASEESFGNDIHDIDIRPPGPTLQASGEPGMQAADRLLIGASAGILPLWLLLRSLVRRTGDPSGKLQRARRKALSRLHRELGTEPDAQLALHAFCRYLGARSGESEAAWIGRDVHHFARPGDREAHGGDWEALGELLERLQRAAYAGGPKLEAQELFDMAQRLVRAGL